MKKFTAYGQNIINDLSNRYGIFNDTVISMLYAVMNGNGTMAQFNCQELGGSGQWMQGGMTMVGDMFNHGLKATVDNLCSELSAILANQQSNLFVPIQKPTKLQQQNNSGQNSLFVTDNRFGNWWPDELGMASSTGAQNNTRYAVFPQTCRLAVEVNGHVTIYNTLDHQIGGVSQQQGYGSSLTFTSQYGLVQVSQLPVVSIDGGTQQPQPEMESIPPENVPQPTQPVENAQNLPDNSTDKTEDIFSMIEKLAALKDKGILSDEEFSTKKTELLKRL
jgi:hypothetical protein